MKPLKRSVSLVIHEPGGDRVLLVRRPDDDESLPGVWGLPATSPTEGESDEDALRRAGSDKLGVDIQPGRLLGEAEAEREAYAIRMRDYDAEIESGEPSVQQQASGTQYVDWRWGDPADLIPAAREGSLCSQILLRAGNIAWA